MNIKFTLRKNSDLETGVLIGKMLDELKELEYRIVEETDNSIKFNDEADFSTNFKLYSRLELAKRMYKGYFEIADLNGKRKIELIYYKSINIELFFVSFFLVVGIFASGVIAFFGLPFIIQFLFFARLTKEANIKMLDRMA